MKQDAFLVAETIHEFIYNTLMEVMSTAEGYIWKQVDKKLVESQLRYTFKKACEFTLNFHAFL